MRNVIERAHTGFRARRVAVILCLVLVAAAVTATQTRPATAADEEPPVLPPNVIVILIDDQTIGQMDAMPKTRSNIVQQGLTLTEGYIPTSLCCPSRASLLTGNHSHTTSVYNNGTAGLGGWQTFHSGPEDQTLATALDTAGYNTALYGKYINKFVKYHPDGYIPPGWDTFVYYKPDFQADGAYYDYFLQGTIDPIHYGHAPNDYSTDVLAGYASEFINDAPADEPFFLYFSPIAVHRPYLPAPRDIDTWPLEPRSAIPALNEKNLSDKPSWIRDNPKIDAVGERTVLTRQHEMLMSVDDAVEQLLGALGNRADNTLIVYLSDNGHLLGSHRITGKNVPHRMATEVPMFLRWDGVIDPGTVSHRVTPNVDLTATIAEATGTTWPMEGRSVLSQERTGTVLEQIEGNDHPAYCGWRTKDYAYVEYDGHGRELYDYTVDPDELHNAAAKPEYAGVVADMRAEAQAACVPTPPGFFWD